jgi:hypothetical protein
MSELVFMMIGLIFGYVLCVRQNAVPLRAWAYDASVNREEKWTALAEGRGYVIVHKERKADEEG